MDTDIPQQQRSSSASSYQQLSQLSVETTTTAQARRGRPAGTQPISKAERDVMLTAIQTFRPRTLMDWERANTYYRVNWTVAAQKTPAQSMTRMKDKWKKLVSEVQKNPPTGEPNPADYRFTVLDILNSIEQDNVHSSAMTTETLVGNQTAVHASQTLQELRGCQPYDDTTRNDTLSDHDVSFNTSNVSVTSPTDEDAEDDTFRTSQYTATGQAMSVVSTSSASLGRATPALRPTARRVRYNADNCASTSALDTTTLTAARSRKRSSDSAFLEIFAESRRQEMEFRMLQEQENAEHRRQEMQYRIRQEEANAEHRRQDLQFRMRQEQDNAEHRRHMELLQMQTNQMLAALLSGTAQSTKASTLSSDTAPT